MEFPTDQISTTLADTDLYKLTMLKWVIQHYPEAVARYELNIRTEVKFTDDDLLDIKRQLWLASEVRFDNRSLKWLAVKSPFLGKPFLAYLKGVTVDPSHVRIGLDNQGHLHGIVEGPWSETILWEIICLAVISEVYFRNHYPALTLEQQWQVYQAAWAKGQGFRERQAHFIEMGTRRRYSKLVQQLVMRGLSEGAGQYMLGTSNVAMAAEFGLTPQGTMAHEIFSAVAAMVGVENANNVVLGKWADTYHGSLGIALPDTFTTGFFLRTFNPFYAKLYDGLRHDSHQDTEVWTDMVLDHYQKLGIDPRSKKLVFSDGISSFDIVDAIQGYRPGEFLRTFGIGTWLTNNLRVVNGSTPLNMVVKLVAAQKNPYEEMRPAIKLSDVPGKAIGQPGAIGEYRDKASGRSLVPCLDDLLPSSASCAPV
jgi:nicotinate phosphoribosyltransferase